MSQDIGQIVTIQMNRIEAHQEEGRKVGHQVFCIHEDEHEDGRDDQNGLGCLVLDQEVGKNGDVDKDICDDRIKENLAGGFGQLGLDNADREALRIHQRVSETLIKEGRNQGCSNQIEEGADDQNFQDLLGRNVAVVGPNGQVHHV